MAMGFQREDQRFVCELDEAELEAVVWMLEQTAHVVEPPEVHTTGDPFADLMAQVGGPMEEGPRDPALARLVPDGHREDAEAAASFRAWTERPLRTTKAKRLRVLAVLLDGLMPKDAEEVRVSLDEDQAASLVAAITDVRLLLADRLGLQTQADAAAIDVMLEAAEASDDPALELARIGPLHAYYSFMSWWQETLSEALLDTGD